MRLNLFEAEDDYIRVGNIMLPKDASQYGYDSYDTVTRKTQKKYDDEKEAERLAKEREEAEKQRKQFIADHQEEIGKAEEILNSGKSDDDKISELFEIFVPRSGISDTVGGEIIRALMRIDYRYYNDGDYFCCGYGLETCGGSADYLASNTSDSINELIYNFVDKNSSIRITDSVYEKFLDELRPMVLSFLTDHLELFATLNTTDSRDFDSGYVSEWDDISHSLEYEVDFHHNGYWYELYEADILSYDDLEEFCEDLTYGGFEGRVTRPYNDVIVIKDLDQDGADHWERDAYREFESWIEEKYEEHRDELEEDDDEEE